MGRSIFQGMGQPQQMPTSGAMQFANPMQKMQYIMQAMTNPAGFMKQHFPDIPDEIMNNPGAIMQYMQQTRGQMPQSEVQKAMGMYQQMYPGKEPK